MPYRVSRMSGAHLRGYTPKPQGYSEGEPLATCGRFDRLEILTPYLPHPESYHLRHLVGGMIYHQLHLFLASENQLKI